ncbi:FkbM family methyltransferase [Patescibacteria group bacterium]|nr:FkbM family methyltransferase [Patescibacteria group bacterium]
MKEFYFGTYEAKLIRIIKTFLKEGDTFIDIGANIGYITAVATGCVGKTGVVHSFEPVPEYFQRIKKIAEINKDYKIIVNPFAMGDENGKIKIYISAEDIGSNTVIPRKDDVKQILEVPIRRLDDYIIENKVDNLKMIKIDVESYELPVLKGLEKYFLEHRDDNFHSLILCEIHPHEGNNLKNILEYMSKFSYHPFNIIKAKERLTMKKIGKEPLINVIFKFCG